MTLSNLKFGATSATVEKGAVTTDYISHKAVGEGVIFW